MKEIIIASVPIIGLFVNALIQVLSFRFFRHLGLLKSIFLGVGAGFFVLVLLSLILSQQWIISIFVQGLTYIALSYCYFHFINLGQTARRIRILREFYDAPNGLSCEELLMFYNSKEIIERRIERLLAGKQIIIKNDKYYIGNSFMLLAARLLVVLKIVLLGKKSEFDKKT
jgi:hypothetical protein